MATSKHSLASRRARAARLTEDMTLRSCPSDTEKTGRNGAHSSGLAFPADADPFPHSPIYPPLALTPALTHTK